MSSGFHQVVGCELQDEINSTKQGSWEVEGKEWEGGRRWGEGAKGGRKGKGIEDGEDGGKH